MTEALQALRELEGAEADRLADRAGLLGRAALGDSVLLAGRKAAEASLRTGEGAIAGPGASLVRLRGDPIFAPLLERELRRAEMLARDLLHEAMRAGFLTDARGRGDATAAESTGLRVRVTMDAGDEAALAAYPVQGHTVAEWARYLIVQLRHGVDAALALPIAGLVGPQAVPAALSDELRLHGARLAMTVREAYFAATAAATRALAAAMTGQG